MGLPIEIFRVDCLGESSSRHTDLTDGAGDVSGEYDGEGVSGVAGGVVHAAEGFWGGRRTGLGGDGVRRQRYSMPNDPGGVLDAGQGR